MKCQHCNSALVDGVCPNAEAHDAERIGAVIATAVRDANAGIAETISSAVTAATAPIAEALRALRPEPVEPPAGGNDTPPHTANGARGVDPADSMRDEFDQRWGDPRRSKSENDLVIRANLEVAGMLMAGARQFREKPVNLEMSERTKRAYMHHVFERGARARIVASEVNDETTFAPRTRAMDTAESGYGAELVGAAYSSSLWEGVRNRDPLANIITDLPMSAPTEYIPIDGSLPEMLFVGESTTHNATAYTTSKTGSSRRTRTAKKFTIQQIASFELNEDSIINNVDFLRMQLAESAALHLGSAMYNGDTTNAGTGNINSDDADPADTRHYLAFDGLRHIWLVDATGQGINLAGAISSADIIAQMRALLVGSINSVNALDNLAWDNPEDLALVVDRKTYLKLLALDEVRTVDKLGAAATILTGQLAAIDGVRIYSPSYATLTEADGKLSETAGSNTLGQMTMFNRRGFLRGTYRPMQMFFDRVQRTDQFLIELYTRVSFTRWGATNMISGVRNITV